jgi:hypothetical protein
MFRGKSAVMGSEEDISVVVGLVKIISESFVTLPIFSPSEVRGMCIRFSDGITVQNRSPSFSSFSPATHRQHNSVPSDHESMRMYYGTHHGSDRF